MRCWMSLSWLALSAGCTEIELAGIDDDTGAPEATEVDPGTGTDHGTGSETATDPEPDPEPDAGPADCLGQHSGWYEGDDDGVAGAVLYEDGTLEVTFVNFVELRADATVAADGSVSGAGFGIAIDGAYDFASCIVTGDWWELAGASNGTWTLARD